MNAVVVVVWGLVYVDCVQFFSTVEAPGYQEKKLSFECSKRICSFLDPWVED